MTMPIEQAQAQPTAAPPTGTPGGGGGTPPPGSSTARGTATGELLTPKPGEQPSPKPGEQPGAKPGAQPPRPRPAGVTMTPEQLNERLSRAQKQALKDTFGTDNPEEIKAKLQRMEELERAHEEQQRAQMTEQQKLQHDLEKERKRSEKLEQELQTMRDEHVVQQQQQLVERIAKQHVTGDLLPEATYLFARHLRTLDPKKIAGMKEGDIARWFQDFVKQKPAFALSPQARTQRTPAGTRTPAPRPKDAATSSTTPTKTFKPGQPNSMSAQEAKAEAAKQGIRW